ncbi:YncE family protein [Actinoallomurus spadix]|uniref:YncE family protein n=1 Tax=Actinoallomurus spadix TaxID=79912 RepID=A0ABN0WPM6_9ACTN|nr:YncE family protein [Actinoallomurus spadix]MCO5984813.1 YncE family protein [Actinoallomurus spadix]
MSGRRVKALVVCAATAAALSVPAGSAGAAGLRDVLLVGNSQSGSVSFIDGRTYQNLGSFNVIGDLQQRLDEMDPIQRAGYETVKGIEGGDRFVDDVQLSPDGRTLYVSRGNLDDAAAFDLVSGRQLWHTRLDGFHADHAALSPDGRRYVISATTAQVAEVLDTATGAVTGRFGTGTYPHQNDYTADGKYIYNSSIGVTSLPQALELLKGSFRLTKVDAATLKVVKTWNLPHGIRPNLIAPDGNTFYAQQSYLNGFIKYDLARSKTVATVTMPYSAHGKALKPDDYPQNSAHHGLALSGDGAKLCDVGTIDDYTAIVDTADLSTKGFVNYPTDSLPYWGTSSVDGTRCFVSLSKANAVSVVDYATATEVARVPVGTFPQRERIGQAAPEAIAALTPAG